ncbi:MAG TPA: hypothetical protein VHI13_16820 [Candidatus Kapabacteria bacterium]|nr:hypothetical protein [Candidatus Kapabacteria bacterium]
MTTDEREQKKRMAALQRLSPESLIKRYLRRQATAAAAAIEMAEISLALESRFPCEKSEEEIRTASGVAQRTVTRSYTIDEAKIDDMRSALDLDFASIVDTKVKHQVPTDRMPELIKHLGATVSRFVKTTTSYSFTKLGSTRIGKPKPEDKKMLASIEGCYSVTPKTSITVKGLSA